MNQVIIKDNTLTTKEKYESISLLTQKVADKTLDQLEKEGIFIFPEIIKDSEDIDEGRMVLQSINNGYRTGNIMGFIGFKEERLVIESRFSTGKQDYLFWYLLERALNIPNVLELNTDAAQDNRLLNLLLFLFPSYLKSAMRKGPYKTYVCRKNNDSNIKGAIDTARHIRKNIPFTGMIAYNQREMSYDNYPMELFRHTIEFIKTKPYGNKLLSKIKDEIAIVSQSTADYQYCIRGKIISENKKNPIRHAYFTEYRQLQRLCIMILQHEKHQIGLGSQQINGILFDGAWLWEEYINSVIGDRFFHPMNKSKIGKQHLFAKKIGAIYPDFISRNTQKRIIADAKYKPISNIANTDYFQLLAYMLRFDAKKGFFIYPEINGTNTVLLRLNKGSTYEGDVEERSGFSLFKYGLHIPSEVENYNRFKKQMEDCEKILMSQFCGC